MMSHDLQLRIQNAREFCMCISAIATGGCLDLICARPWHFIVSIRKSMCSRPKCILFFSSLVKDSFEFRWNRCDCPLSQK